MEEWEIDRTWKENNIVDFWTFFNLLSVQILRYNPTHRKYAGESNMRPDTQQNQDARDKSKDDERVKIVRPLVEGLQFSNFEKFKEANYRRGANSRLCGNITQIDMHIKS